MAEARAVRWLDGEPNEKQNIEKICPARHIRQNQWQAKWNKDYLTARAKWTYDYISDYECVFNHPIDTDDLDDNQVQWDNLNTAKRKGTNISITNLAHFTKPEKADGIIKTGGFRGTMKKINEDIERHDITAKLSWWSPIFTEDDNKQLNQVRDTLGAAIQPFLDDDQDDDQDDQDALLMLKNQFATSDAFKPKSWRYGSRYFQYGIIKLCEYYEKSIHADDLQFKILGTFGYKQEVMHAVLVCSEANGAGRFRAYPSVLTPEEDVDNEEVVTRDDDGNWIWKPQATATEIRRLPDHKPYPMYRRWEHVAFAFHLPNETLMFVPNLQDNRHDLPEDQQP